MKAKRKKPVAPDFWQGRQEKPAGITRRQVQESIAALSIKQHGRGVYAGLGEKEQALAALERAYAAHDLQMMFLGRDQHCDSRAPSRASRN